LAVPIGEVYSSVLQSSSLSKLQGPDSFSIPCCIGDVQIKRALCDLGASVSLMPLSLCKKLELLDLKPVTMLIQLAYRTIKRSADILDDVLVQVGKLVISCDFIVMDMNESPQMSILLERLFLATAGPVIDMQAGTISFRIWGEMVDFCFPPPTASSVPANLLPSAAPMPTITPSTVSKIKIFDGNGGPYMMSIGFSDFSVVVPASLGSAPTRSWEVVTASPFTTVATPPPPILPSLANMR